MYWVNILHVLYGATGLVIGRCFKPALRSHQHHVSNLPKSPRERGAYFLKRAKICHLSITYFFFYLLFANLAYCRPAIFWAADPVRPNESVIVAGSDFGSYPRVLIGATPAGDPGQPPIKSKWVPNKPLVQAEILQPSNESLKFIVPPTFNESVYLFQIEDETGQRSPLKRLNAPTVYWMQGDLGIAASSPGGWLSIFGRCVGEISGRGVVVLQKKESNQTFRIIPKLASAWRVQVKIPNNLHRGTWQVFIHNGRGGRLGWTHAGTLALRRKEKWPACRMNVKDFGATGRGKNKDISAIRAAIKAADAAGGGTVFFPGGRYRMKGTLIIPRHVRLIGKSRKRVSLFWPKTGKPCILIKGKDHFSLQDLTLYASNYKAVITGDIDTPTAGHVVLQRLRIRADMYSGHLTLKQIMQRQSRTQQWSISGPDTIRLGGPGIVIRDCDIYGSGRSLYLYKARGACVFGNTFYNGRWGWYSLSGSDGLIFENNQIVGADLMSTGGGINCLGGLPYSRFIYFAHNQFSLFHGWDREAMTTDGPGAAYFGSIKAVHGAEITLAKRGQWENRDWHGAAVFILDGRGMGQYREIAGIGADGRTVRLDRPWVVQPDSSSRITITPMQRNYLFIDNQFKDAGIALQYYGTSIDCIASGNVATRAGGFYNSGRWYHGYQPSWFCQFLGNTIAEGNGYRFGPNNSIEAGESFIGTLGLRYGKSPPLLAYCTIHRGNVLHNNAYIRIAGYNKNWPGVRDVVIENNLVENTAVGLSVDQGAKGVVLRNNIVNLVGP